MDNLPSYYLPGSRLSVKLVDGGSDADVSFAVVSAFTPFTMSQVLLVQSDSDEERRVVKVYDPRFMSHRFQGVSQRPWAQTAEIQAAEQRRQNVPFEFDFPERPEDEDKAGWEEWYFQQADMAASSEIAAYDKLGPLQGQGVTKCFGSGTLNLPDRPISPRVLILEYLLNVQSLEKVETKLITPQIIDSLKETATAFGRLGVAHCDLNYSNILFLVGDEGISRAVIIDFGSSCTRELEQSDEEWASVVQDQDDVSWLERRLARMIKERP